MTNPVTATIRVMKKMIFALSEKNIDDCLLLATHAEITVISFHPEIRDSRMERSAASDQRSG
jgi:hypothetical protein